MYEYGSIYTLTGSDGTSVIFNDGISGLVLEDVTGFDSPTIRTNVEDMPEADGALAGDSWYGRRPVTLKGRIYGLTASDRNATVINLQRALRGLRQDMILVSQPSGLPNMRATGRIESLRVTGGFVKEFLISIICPDPGIYSDALNSITGTGAGTPAPPGAAFPIVFPMNFGGGSSIGGYAVSINVANVGNFSTPLLIQVGGPISDPQVTDPITGESIYIDNVTLAVDQWLEIDTGLRTVTRNDGVSLYANVRFPGSVWFGLSPGSATLQLWGSGNTVDTDLTATYRDCWL
jgi:hypothetical protein